MWAPIRIQHLRETTVGRERFICGRRSSREELELKEKEEKTRERETESLLLEGNGNKRNAVCCVVVGRTNVN